MRRLSSSKKEMNEKIKKKDWHISYAIRLKDDNKEDIAALRKISLINSVYYYNMK